MTDIPRQVLVELGAPVRWDSSRLGAGLSLSGPDADGGHTVTRTGGAATTSALTALPVRGSWVCVVEIVALPSGAVAVGVRKTAQRRWLLASRPVHSSRDQDATAGGKAGGFGITSGGTKYTEGATSATGVTWAAGDTFVVRYDEFAAELSIAKNDGAAVATWSSLRGPFELIGTCGATGASLRIVSDVDHVPWTRRFRPAGIWGRLALFGWMSAHADTICRDTYFDGRLDPDAEPTWTIRPSIPLLDGNRPDRPVGDFQVLNADRGVDHLLDWSTRDEPITILRGSLRDTYDAFYIVGVGRIEDLASSGDETRIRITPRDALVVLDAAWSVETYPSSGVVASLAGQTKPTAIGQLQHVPLTMRDAPNLLYDLGDDAVFSVSDVLDQGVALTLGAGYSVTSDRKGIARLTNPTGKQCATIIGSVADSTVYVDSVLGDFGPWSGSPAAPAGWTYPGFTNGTSTVTNASPGARFQSNGAGGTFASLHRVSVFATGAAYIRVDVVVVVASGSINIRLTDFGANVIDANVAASGTYTFFVLKPSAAVHLQVFTNFVASDVTVRSLRMTRVEAMDGLSWWMRHAVCERGGLSGDTLDSASISTVEAARPWPLCLYTGPGDKTRIIDVLDQTAASFGGGWYATPAGRLSLLMLVVEPAPGATLTDVEIIGEIKRDLCIPRGLSDRVAGMPNWSVHADADIAGSLLTTSGGRALAEALKSEYLSIKRGTNQLASVYDSAAGADPIKTLLSTATGVQGLADAVTAFFAVPRWIYTLSVHLSALDDQVEWLVGQTLLVVSAAYDLDEGKPLLVIGASGRYSSSVAELTLLG